jgi:hypothetical protein
LAGHVTRIREKNHAHKILLGYPEKNRPLGRPKRRRRIILKMDLKYNGVLWTGLIWFRIKTNGGLL